MPNPSLPVERPPVGRAILVALVILVVAAGCGSSEGVDDGPVGPGGDGPRVADARFDGNFEIVDLRLDGTGFDVAQRPSIDIETEFGGLTVLPGCNTYFGSFSLDEDGRASFTVTGGSDNDCGALAAQEEAVLAALAAADQWVETETGFRFEGSGSSLSVAGPAG